MMTEFSYILSLMFFIHILEKSNAQGAWNHRVKNRSMYIMVFFALKRYMHLKDQKGCKFTLNT